MKRLSAIDGLRGLIVILMVMHHTLDAWVRDPERHGFLWARLEDLGGLPAPGFMLLAGLSAAMVAARERRKGMSAKDRAVVGVKRGLYVLGIAFSFRVVAFSMDVAPDWYGRIWPIIFRVDILNSMGIALALVAALASLARTPSQSMAIAFVIAAAFFLPAPLLWGHEFSWPSPLLANYVSGVQPLVLFPLFPWVGFAAIGYAAGEWIAQTLADGKEPPNALIARATWPFVGIGLLTVAVTIWLGWAPLDLYPPHDYWHSSPVYMAMKAAIQLVLLGLLAQWWKSDAEGKRGAFLQLLGRHSLFVYLVHLEMVFGRIAWPIQHQLSVFESLRGAAEIVLGFAVACWVMEWWKARGSARTQSKSTPPPVAAPSPDPT
jgi:uncharacterized membrane protein